MQYPIEYYDVQQKSPEWYDIRLGKITASKLKDLKKVEDGAATKVANKDKAKGEEKVIVKKWGSEAQKYMLKLAVERITGRDYVGEEFQPYAAFEHGNRCEPLARKLMEQANDIDVFEVGCYSYGDLFVCSPDGIVDIEGVPIEIKAPYSSIDHINAVITGSVPEQYRLQIQAHMMVTKMAYAYYVSYGDTMPEGKKLHVIKVQRCEQTINEIIELCIEANAFIEEAVKNYDEMVNCFVNGAPF